MTLCSLLNAPFLQPLMPQTWLILEVYCLYPSNCTEYSIQLVLLQAAHFSYVVHNFQLFSPYLVFPDLKTVYKPHNEAHPHISIHPFQYTYQSFVVGLYYQGRSLSYNCVFFRFRLACFSPWSFEHSNS